MEKHNLKVLYGKAIPSEATYRFVLCLILITIFISCLVDGIERRFLTFTMMQNPTSSKCLSRETQFKVISKNLIIKLNKCKALKQLAEENG